MMEMWVMKQRWVSWEQNPRREERRVVAETINRAQPKEVGGNLKRMMGAKEAEEMKKRQRFRAERMR